MDSSNGDEVKLDFGLSINSEFGHSITFTTEVSPDKTKISSRDWTSVEVITSSGYESYTDYIDKHSSLHLKVFATLHEKSAFGTLG